MPSFKMLLVMVVIFFILSGVLTVLLTFLFPIEGGYIGEGKIESIKNDMIYTAIDSLKKINYGLRRELFKYRVLSDSLENELSTKSALVYRYEKTIEDLKKQLEMYTVRENSIKELAKTYEAMTPEEIAPILSNVDDNTIINIYFNMTSRKRQNILRALPSDRAARLTKKIAEMGGS